jgi:methylated-DNA-protein-cysteine methyltransferase-like protein
MNFSEKVYQLAKKISKGKVATYGQIAARLGKPKAARAVGNALHRNPDPKTIPCHRVVNREGRLAPNFGGKGWQKQRKMLLAEGVKFKKKTHVDLTSCQWNF